jgi:hypothetical protein
MADRTEKVVYKVVVDTSDVPNELPGGQATLPGIPAEPSGTPSDPQKVSVNRAGEGIDTDRLAEVFARLMRMPQFPAAMGDSFAVFLNRMGLGGALSRMGSAAGLLPGLGGGAGAAGAMGAAGPIGLGIGAGLLLQHQVRQATGMMMAGRNQMVGGVLDANASGIMKGWARMNGGMLHLGPLAPIADKLVETFGHLVDVADRLSDSLGHFNGQIAAAEAQYRVAQVQARIRMGQAFGPTLAAWNHLKSEILNVGSSAISVLFAGFDKLTGLSHVLDGISVLTNWAGKAMGLGGVMNGQQMSGEEMAARMRLASAGAGLFNATLTEPHLRGQVAGELPNIPGRIGPPGLVDKDVRHIPRDYRDIQKAAEDVKKQEQQIRDMQTELDKYRTRNPKDASTIKQGEAAIDYQKKELQFKQQALDSARKQLDRDKTANQYRARNIGVPGPLHHVQRHDEAPDNPHPWRKDTPPPKSPSKPKPQAFAPLRSMDIQQSVQFKLDMKLAHEKQVHDAIMQVRDRLLQGMSTARDESRLALAMLNLGGSGGMI